LLELKACSFVINWLSAKKSAFAWHA